jgi:hypothetical protein
LKVWLEHSGITEGAAFRRPIGKAQIGGALNPGSIAPIFKRVAQWIGMPERFVGQVSRHSTRVAANQDMAALVSGQRILAGPMAVGRRSESHPVVR